jgi:hypothetical protein
MQRIFQQVYQLNDLYDNLTRHGTNPDIDTARGEAMAKQQFESGVQQQQAPPPVPPQLQTQQQPPPVQARIPAPPHRSRSSKLWALGALVVGGLLLAYGFLSYGRRW